MHALPLVISLLGPALLAPADAQAPAAAPAARAIRLQISAADGRKLAITADGLSYDFARRAYALKGSVSVRSSDDARPFQLEAESLRVGLTRTKDGGIEIQLEGVVKAGEARVTLPEKPDLSVVAESVGYDAHTKEMALQGNVRVTGGNGFVLEGNDLRLTALPPAGGVRTLLLRFPPQAPGNR